MNLSAKRSTTASKRTMWLDEVIYGHDLFGNPGEAAPCSCASLAGIIGCGANAVQTRRKRAGVLGYIQTPEECRERSLRAARTRSKFVMPDEYSLCHYTNNWSRPDGMDEILCARKRRAYLEATRHA